MAATLTTEAELKAWYLANNPTLRSQGLSCPKALYKEMQRDLRYFNTMVAIIPVIDSDDIERMVNEFFINAKPDHVTCRMRQLCLMLLSMCSLPLPMRPKTGRISLFCWFSKWFWRRRAVLPGGVGARTASARRRRRADLPGIGMFTWTKEQTTSRGTSPAPMS